MSKNIHALLDQIESSQGTLFINRSHHRSFSLNIFQTNARELIAASRQISDPEHGVHLMSVDNKEAGHQAHREINRLVHNFAAGSMTLIDHTRVLIKKNYGGTDLEANYIDRVKVDFASKPIAKFVQDLRNYMVHRGLPDSQMFIYFDNKPDTDSSPQLITGVRYETSPLKTWDGWTAPARAYIEASGEHIDIQSFVEDYQRRVATFHEWLDGELQDFHRDDLVHLQEMQQEYERLSATLNGINQNTPNPFIEKDDSAILTLGGALSSESAIENFARTVLSKIRPLSFASYTNDEFQSERPISTIITDQTIRETAVIRRDDADGQSVVGFIASGKQSYGLNAADYEEIYPLIDQILGLDWAKSILSRKFIEDKIVEWLRASFEMDEPESLLKSIRTASLDSVKTLYCWVPIAHLEVEEAFDFGPVKVAPITTAMIDALEMKGVAMAPSQREDITAMFKDLRARMQGYAAVVTYSNAESERAREGAIAIAQNVVGLLRFFAPMAQYAWPVIPIALLGMEINPRSQALVLGEDSFCFNDGLISSPYCWRLSKTVASKLQGPTFVAASKLVVTDGLSDFAQAVRASILLYSTGATLHNHKDRLIYNLSSVEMLLIKHSSEAVEFNVEERMAFVFSESIVAANETSKNVREAYRLRRKHGVFSLTPHDEQVLAIFAENAYRVILTALSNINSFETKASFVDAIEDRKSTIP